MLEPFDLGEALRPIAESLPDALRAVFLAALEENAAGRYRGWAECADPETAEGLRRCAKRESEIAEAVRALYPTDPSQGDRLSGALAAAADVGRRAFEGRPRAEQFAIQAGAERRGAAVWRALAEEAEGDEERRALLRCAELEEASAAFLEGVVRRGLS